MELTPFVFCPSAFVPNPTRSVFCVSISRLGEPDRQITLLSSVSAILAVLLIYRVVLDTLDEPTWRAATAAGVAALGLAISPLFWSQAMIAEVHTLNAFGPTGSTATGRSPSALAGKDLFVCYNGRS